MITDYAKNVRRMEERVRDSESRASEASKQVICLNKIETRLIVIKHSRISVILILQNGPIKTLYIYVSDTAFQIAVFQV